MARRVAERKRRHVGWDILATVLAAIPGLVVLVLITLERAARAGTAAQLDEFNRSVFNVILHLLGMASLGSGLLAILLTTKFWAAFPPGIQAALTVMVLISFVGTLSYWGPMFEFFFGSWG